MSDLVGNPEDRFSRVTVQMLLLVHVHCQDMFRLLLKGLIL